MRPALCVTIFIFPMFATGTPASLLQLREQARTVTQKSHCASCHTPGNSSKEAALQVFNLRHKHWSSTMDNRQLDRYGWALSKATDEEIKSMGIDPSGKRLTASESKVIVRYVEEELKFRRANPQKRFEDIQRDENPGFYSLMDSANATGEGCVL